MPRKKSGIGKSSGDNFSAKKNAPEPKEINQYRQGTRFSFRVSAPRNKEPENCGEIDIPDKAPDLLHPVGRKQGQDAEYDPVQTKNYLSQAARYEKALNLVADKIETLGDGGRVFWYCSPDAPGGYWQVTVGGFGTYVKFPKGILTIICPRPFHLSEINDAPLTDSATLHWSQYQGRATVINPTDGDGSLDPLLVIIGDRSATDPPIILRAEIPGNASAFDILLIATTAQDILSGFSCNTVSGPIESDPCLAPSCDFGFVPTRASGGGLWTGEPLLVTWGLPSCSLSFLTETVWQANTTGVYQDVQSFPVGSQRQFYANPDTYYRIIARYNQSTNGRGREFTGGDNVDGCRLFFSSPTQTHRELLLADESLSPSFSFIGVDYAVVDRTSTQNPSGTDTLPATSFSFVGADYAITLRTVQKVQPGSDTLPGSSFKFIRASYTVVARSGVVIG